MKKLLLLLAAATFVAACSKDAEEFDNFPQIVDGLTVTVETPGTLAELLAPFDAEAITELIVRGNLNSDDISVLRDNLPNLAVLDMESVDLKGWIDFYHHKSLTAVRLPKNLTYIGYNAFAGCSSLTSMTIPQSVTKIDFGAFQNCKSWTGKLTIPKGVTEIRGYAFSNCKNLTGELVIPKGVTKIERGTFRGCSGLTGELVIPQWVTDIGELSFKGCEGLTGKLVIPEGITHIYKEAFQNCSGLTSITFPQSLIDIYCTAFRECNNVTAIYCKATEPPSVYKIKGDDVPAGDNFNYAATLYVPVGTAEAYKAATCWKKFENIIEMEF